MSARNRPHCVYQTRYHIVFPVKYRKALLSTEIGEKIKRIAEEIEKKCGSHKSAFVLSSIAASILSVVEQVPLLERRGRFAEQALPQPSQASASIPLT